MHMMKKLSFILALMLIFCATAVAESDLQTVNFQPSALNAMDLDAATIMVTSEMRALATVALSLDLTDAANFEVDLSQSTYVGRDGETIYFYLHGESSDAIVGYIPFLDMAVYVLIPLNAPDSIAEGQLDTRCPDGWYKNDTTDIYNVLVALYDALSE